MALVSKAGFSTGGGGLRGYAFLSQAPDPIQNEGLSVRIAGIPVYSDGNSWLTFSDNSIFPGVYVSNTGNDSRDGSSPVEAVATLSKAESLAQDGGVILLEAGSSWEDTIVSSKKLRISAFNYIEETAPLPKISTLATITGFSDEGTPNVYQVSVPAYDTFSGYPGILPGRGKTPWIYEIDGSAKTALAYRDAIAEVSTNPGTFTFTGSAENWANNGTTAFIHSTDSTDPGANGRTYKASKRMFAVASPSNDVIVSQVNCDDVSAEDGAILLTGYRSEIDSCLIRGCTKHSAVILKADGVIKRTISYDPVPDDTQGGEEYWSGGRTDYAIYEGIPAPGVVSQYDGCVVADGSGIGLYAHTSGGGNNTAQVIFRNNYVFNKPAAAISAADTDEIVAQDNYIENSRWGITGQTEINVDGLTFIYDSPAVGPIPVYGATLTSIDSINVSNLAVAGGFSLNEAIRSPGNRTLTHTSVYTPERGTLFTKSPSGESSGEFSASKSVLEMRRLYLYETDATGGTSSDNLLLGDVGDGTQSRADLFGVQYFGASAINAQISTLEVGSIDNGVAALWSDANPRLSGNFAIDANSQALQSGRNWGALRWRTRPNLAAMKDKWNVGIYAHPEGPTGGSELVVR
ncbi:hypothetical protein Lepto7375DRAFT_7284 [Leptolyngbya sp. PCC 7375]|nr:hypothetical protein Lepto7375DRAFT_7284 [Leptolyngbya sp. PCC 7375]